MAQAEWRGRGAVASHCAQPTLRLPTDFVPQHLQLRDHFGGPATLCADGHTHNVLGSAEHRQVATSGGLHSRVHAPPSIPSEAEQPAPHLQALAEIGLLKTRHPTVERPQSRGEEIANSVSHGVGLAAALAGAPVLIVAAARHGTTINVVAAAIFSGTTVLLYLASTLYHAIPQSGAKNVFRTLDHGAIYLLIAGTYTPFTLGVLRGAWGWSLFGVVWALAILGVVLKAVNVLRHPVLSTALYITMGWLVVIAIRPLWLYLPAAGGILLVLGGIAYTGGVAFYTAERVRYGHFLWHLCVLAGTVCHYFAVLWYAS